MRELKSMFVEFFRNKKSVMVFLFVIGLIAMMYAGFYAVYLLNR